MGVSPRKKALYSGVDTVCIILLYVRIRMSLSVLRNILCAIIMEFGEAIKNPAYRIFQTEYSGCLDISAHA